jgi:hypothetical protein
LVHKPHVLLALRFPSIEHDDHGRVESLLSDCPAYENGWMAVTEEKKSLQQLDRTVDYQSATADRSLMVTAIRTTSR